MNKDNGMHSVRQQERRAKGGAAAWLLRHKRFGLILLGIAVLNGVYGFDARFTFINLLWVFISIVKIDRV